MKKRTLKEQKMLKLRKLIREQVRRVIREERVDDSSEVAKEIANMTGTNVSAVQSFINKNNLDIFELIQWLGQGGSTEKRDFATALSGRDGNPYQKNIINKFGLK